MTRDKHLTEESFIRAERKVQTSASINRTNENNWQGLKRRHGAEEDLVYGSSEELRPISIHLKDRLNSISFIFSIYFYFYLN